MGCNASSVVGDVLGVPQLGKGSGGSKNDPALPLHILSVGGAVLTQLSLPSTTTVAKVKEHVRDRLGVPVYEQRLLGVAGVENCDCQISELMPDSGPVQITLVRVYRQMALTGSLDKTIKLWDIEKQKVLKELHGHTSSVQCFSVDWPSLRALSGSHDNTMRLWELDTGSTLLEINHHYGPIWCVVMDYASRRALSGSDDRMLRLWDLSTGGELMTLSGHSGLVSAVALDWNSKRALSGSTDRTLRLWDLVSADTLHVFRGHSDLVLGLAVDWISGQLVSQSFDSTMRLWSFANPADPIRELKGHTSQMRCMAVDWLGNLAIAGDERALRIWDLQTGDQFKSLKAKSQVWCVSVDHRLQQVLSGCADGELTLWDLQASTKLAKFKAHQGTVLCVAMNSASSIESETAL